MPSSPADQPIFTSDELAALTGGTWTVRPESPITAIREDFARIEPGLTSFLFAPEFWAGGAQSRFKQLDQCVPAMAQGAAACLVSRQPRNVAASVPCLVVNSVSQAVASLGRARRKESRASFVGVTGSTGKTTTKNMIAALAETNGPVGRSLFNINNGTKSKYFTVANLPPDAEYCVAEFGLLNNDEQAAFFRPNVAVVTTITREHAGDFELNGAPPELVLEYIVDHKCRILPFVQAGGAAVINHDDELFARTAGHVKAQDGLRLITFGRHDAADVRLTHLDAQPDGSVISATAFGETLQYRLSVPGAHMAMNSLAAIATAYALNIPVREALPVFEHFSPDLRRGEMSEIPWKGGTLLGINETVSSSLPSVRATLRMLCLQQPGPGGRRIAVLGTIGDLGSRQLSDMRELAADAAELPVDMIYTFDEVMDLFNDAFPDRARIAPHAQTVDELEHRLRADLRPGDVVLFKGGMHSPRFSARKLWTRLFEVQASASPDERQVLKRGRVVIAGNTYLGESYQARREAKGHLNYLQTFGYDRSLQRLSPLLARADEVVVNLECALTGPSSPSLPHKTDGLRGDPTETARALAAAHVSAAMLANNHAFDYGERGLADTLEALRTNGIQAFGAGRTQQQADAPLCLELRHGDTTAKLALLSCYQHTELFDARYHYFAGETTAGVSRIDADRLGRQTAALKNDGYYVFVLPHWGDNYSFREYSRQGVADRLLDAGADAIIGHGPHFANEVEFRSGRCVAYSLGNFVFNSEGDHEPHRAPPFSLLSELDVMFLPEGFRLALNFYPIVSSNKMTQFRPSFVSERQFQSLVGLLRNLQFEPGDFDEVFTCGVDDGRYFFRCSLL